MEILEDDTKRQKGIAEKIQDLKLEEQQARALQKLINLMIVHMQEKEALQEQEKEPFDADLVEDAFQAAYAQLSRQEKESVTEIIKKDGLGLSGLQKIASSIIAAVMIEGAVKQIKADKPELEDVEVIEYTADALMNYTVVPIESFFGGPIGFDEDPTLNVPEFSAEFKQVADKIKQETPTSTSTSSEEPPSSEPTFEPAGEEEPQYATTFKSKKERTNIVQGEIQKMSEDVPGMEDEHIKAANLFVNKLLSSVIPLNEGITDDFPNYKKQIAKILTGIELGGRRNLRVFKKRMEDAGRYQKFLKYVKDLLSASKQQSAEQLIKEKLQNILSENEDDTLPSTYKPPGFLDKIKQVAMEIYDMIKGMFAGEVIRPEEIENKVYQMGSESPRVLDILLKQAQERKVNASEMSQFLKSLGVADLKAMDAEDPLMTDFMQTDLYDDDPLP